jgi:hypothetical protein
LTKREAAPLLEDLNQCALALPCYSMASEQETSSVAIGTYISIAV